MAAPTEAGVQTQFLYRPAGSTDPWTALSTLQFETGYLADVSALGTGNYDFQVNYIRQNDTAPYATTTGTIATLADDGGSATVSDFALGTGGFISRETRYDAFGEAVAKGVNGGSQEYFDYDNAGNLWRTNMGDGVDKVALHDLQGDTTADIRSKDRPLGPSAFARPDDIAFLGDTVRTEMRYDLRGREVTQVRPSWVEGTSGSVSQESAFVSAAIDAGAQSVLLSWSSLQSLGSGDVRVDLDYINNVVNTDESGNVISVTNSPASLSRTFDASSAVNGATITTPDGIVSVTRVRVWKKDVDGQWAQVLDRSTLGAMGNLVTGSRPRSPTSATACCSTPRRSVTRTSSTRCCTSAREKRRRACMTPAR